MRTKIKNALAEILGLISHSSVYHLYPLWRRLWNRHARDQKNDGDKKKKKKKSPASILGPLAVLVGPTLAVSACFELVRN